MTKPLKALILANGDPPSAALLAQLVAEHHLFIAADGAARKADALGQSPDIISGDFDSLSHEEACQQFSYAEIIPTPDQNQGDLEKAIGIARERGARTVTITGASGGRLDHMLGTIALLLRYHTEFPLRLVDDGSETRALSGTNDGPGEWVIDTTPGDTISVISFDGRAQATLKGVRWPLHQYPMPIGTLGISNRAEANTVLVQAHRGTLLVCHLTP